MTRQQNDPLSQYGEANKENVISAVNEMLSAYQAGKGSRDVEKIVELFNKAFNFIGGFTDIADFNTFLGDLKRATKALKGQNNDFLQIPVKDKNVTFIDPKNPKKTITENLSLPDSFRDGVTSAVYNQVGFDAYVAAYALAAMQTNEAKNLITLAISDTKIPFTVETASRIVTTYEKKKKEQEQGKRLEAPKLDSLTALSNYAAAYNTSFMGNRGPGKIEEGYKNLKDAVKAAEDASIEDEWNQAYGDLMALVKQRTKGMEPSSILPGIQEQRRSNYEGTFLTEVKFDPNRLKKLAGIIKG